MHHLPGKFVWYEHLSRDTAKARAFYEAVFGWHVERMPLGGRDYEMLLNAGDGVGGLCEQGAADAARWVSYVSTADVDATYAQALAAGATGEMPPTDFTPVGRGAAIVDPGGARLSLWTGTRDDPPDGAPAPPGGFCWTELWTREAAPLLAFYRGLFGYDVQDMDLGDGNTYHVLTQGPAMRGGLYAAAPDVPTQWLPYVEVADCDGTLGKARERGASTMLEPHDVADVGRIAIFVDPQGAALGLITSRAR